MNKSEIVKHISTTHSLNPSWYETKLKSRQHNGYKGYKVFCQALQI